MPNGPPRPGPRGVHAAPGEPLRRTKMAAAWGALLADGDAAAAVFDRLRLRDALALRATSKALRSALADAALPNAGTVGVSGHRVARWLQRGLGAAASVAVLDGYVGRYIVSALARQTHMSLLDVGVRVSSAPAWRELRCLRSVTLARGTRSGLVLRSLPPTVRRIALYDTDATDADVAACPARRLDELSLVNCRRARVWDCGGGYPLVVGALRWADGALGFAPPVPARPLRPPLGALLALDVSRDQHAAAWFDVALLAAMPQLRSLKAAWNNDWLTDAALAGLPALQELDVTGNETDWYDWGAGHADTNLAGDALAALPLRRVVVAHCYAVDRFGNGHARATAWYYGTALTRAAAAAHPAATRLECDDAACAECAPFRGDWARRACAGCALQFPACFGPCANCELGALGETLRLAASVEAASAAATAVLDAVARAAAWRYRSWRYHDTWGAVRPALRRRPGAYAALCALVGANVCTACTERASTHISGDALCAHDKLLRQRTTRAIARALVAGLAAEARASGGRPPPHATAALVAMVVALRRRRPLDAERARTPPT
jgi:hypothetical protein